MAEKPWDKGFLMPELPAEQPWQRCLYCSGFVLWGGSLAACDRRKKVLCPGAHYDRRRAQWLVEGGESIKLGMSTVARSSAI